MKKVTQISVLVLTFIFLFLIVSVCYNCMKTKEEESLLTPLGITIPIDDGHMSLYTEGSGDKTLVFLSGGGTTSPILDFKSLYKNLSDTYKIVVVEKFGYGFSAITPRQRDINQILSDTRLALQKANITGPFILVPHSLSGIEALYWAQRYPSEVEAIIGLDMCTPFHYDQIKLSLSLTQLTRSIHHLGITRFIPGIWKGDAVKYGTLTDKEKEIYKALFFKNTLNRNMMDELKEIKNNASIVQKGPSTNIPILLIVSNGKGTGMKTDIWRRCSEAFNEYNRNCEIIKYDAPHYIHNHKYNEISEDIDNFIDIL